MLLKIKICNCHKTKVGTKFKNQYKFYFETLIVASYYYCGDNT